MSRLLDSLIVEFDRGLRALAAEPRARRAYPAAAIEDTSLSDLDRRHAAGLMRVNHCGEVCAQALYQGQALASRNDSVRAALESAAREEQDHLAWTRRRIGELEGRVSVLNPIWYAGSLAMGFAAGKLGDAWNLGFLAETESQVGKHLEGHLERLSPGDAATRAVLQAMHTDEAGHARVARGLGARELPAPVKLGMRWAARLMTKTSYWV
jgi:ubiquinone biosynthesis monooxygenase Coq7